MVQENHSLTSVQQNIKIRTKNELTEINKKTPRNRK